MCVPLANGAQRLEKALVAHSVFILQSQPLSADFFLIAKRSLLSRPQMPTNFHSKSSAHLCQRSDIHQVSVDQLRVRISPKAAPARETPHWQLTSCICVMWASSLPHPFRKLHSWIGYRNIVTREMNTDEGWFFHSLNHIYIKIILDGNLW